MNVTRRLAFVLLSLALTACGWSAAPSNGRDTHPIWVSGEDGVNVYTIPGVLVTRSGVVLAYAEARETRGDGGKVDLVIKRSLDGGRTWQKSNFIERARGIENYVLATLVQDRVSGRVYFFSALRDEGLPDKTTTNSYRYSDDDGATWSDPVDITPILYAADEKQQQLLRSGSASAEFKGDDPELFGRKLIFFGPGRSIQLSATHPSFPNRLIVPLFYIKDRIVTPRSKRGYGDAVLVSDDGGRTWSVPGIVPLGSHGSSEVSIVERADGALVLNARAAPPASSRMSVAGRTVSISTDGGATWTRPKPDTSGIPDYIETSSGLLRLSHPATDPTKTSRILFSFPHSVPDPSAERGMSAARANGTVLLSYDEGQSWAVRKLVVPGSFGYSNLDVLPDGTVVMVHEDARGTQVTCTRFTLDWLTDGADTHAAGPRKDGGEAARVLERDAQRQRALVAADVTALRGIIDPACVYTHASGRVQTGEDYLAAFTRGDVRYRAMRYEFPPTLVMRGNDMAVISGRTALTSQAPGGTPNERVLATTAVYARQGEAWKLSAYQSTPAAPAPVHQVLSHHLAVKDVCAWPKLVQMKDGTIVAAVYNQPSHGLMPGDVACWASTDGGKTWEHRGNATRHTGNSAWFNHALGLAGNGDLLVASSGWDYQEGGAKQNVPLVPIVTRSSDGGRSWRKVSEIPASPEAGKAFIPFGNIERGDDGSLRFAAYSYARGLPPPRQDTGHVLISRDDGATWSVGAEIGHPEVNETDLFFAGNGRWLAAARNLTAGPARSAHSIDLYVSTDNGATWQRHARVTQPNAHPGDLLKLQDGRVLLTYGDRRPPTFGVNAIVSGDGGNTWSPEFQIVSGLSSRDSGYPSSVQLADGTIVTAYYAKGSSLHDGYQMSVVRWKLK